MSLYYANQAGDKTESSEEEVRKLIAEGTLSHETLGWKEGMADWEPLHRIYPDLGAESAIPRPSLDTAVAGTGVGAATAGGGAALAGAGASPGDDLNPYNAPSADLGAASAVDGLPGRLSLKDVLWSFKGRISRSQYWLGTVITVGLAVVAFIPLILSGALDDGDTSAATGNLMSIVGPIIFFILLIPLIWMSLAIKIKRWHDRDKKGWWCLIELIPLYIGTIWAFIENGCLAGTPGPNRFGNDPVE